jgi:hypothetical protein
MKRVISLASHSKLSYSSSSLELSYHLFVLALLVSFENNLLLLCGSDAFGEVLDVVGFFNIHFMVHDLTKHIIG